MMKKCKRRTCIIRLRVTQVAVSLTLVEICYFFEYTAGKLRWPISALDCLSLVMFGGNCFNLKDIPKAAVKVHQPNCNFHL